MPHPVVHFDIAGTDAKRTQKFYTSLFDWQLDTSFGPDYGMVAGSEGGIGGGLMATMMGKPFVTIYVQVDDVSTYLDKAIGLGGKQVAGPTDMPNGAKWALFEDPDGNTIGLYAGSGADIIWESLISSRRGTRSSASQQCAASSSSLEVEVEVEVVEVELELEKASPTSTS